MFQGSLFTLICTDSSCGQPLPVPVPDFQARNTTGYRHTAQSPSINGRGRMFAACRENVTRKSTRTPHAGGDWSFCSAVLHGRLHLLWMSSPDTSTVLQLSNPLVHKNNLFLLCLFPPGVPLILLQHILVKPLPVFLLVRILPQILIR